MKKLLYGLLIVSAMQNVSLHGAYLTSDRVKEILDYNIQNNSIHSFGESCILDLLKQLSREERAIYALKVLNHYQETNKIYEFNRLYELLICLPPAEREIYASNIFNYYLKTNSVHELKNPHSLLINLSKAEYATHVFNILNRYNHKRTLFKYDSLIELIKNIRSSSLKLLFDYPQNIFTQELTSIDQNYHRQLHMCYIRKTIEKSNLPVESSFFSEELLKPLLLEDIVAIIEHIHESTDICGESMKKVRPLCQAYLMLCEDLPNSMPIEHFTDLFESSLFRTQTSSLTETPDSSKTPQKIQELYAQYRHTNIIGNTIIVSRDEQPSVEQ